MARKDLKNVLDRIVEDIEKTSTAYRTLKSDKKVHTFKVELKKAEEESKLRIIELFSVADQDTDKILKDLWGKIKPHVKAMCNNFYEELKKQQASTKTYTIELKGTPDNFSAGVTPVKGDPDVFYWLRRNIKQKGQKEELEKVQKIIDDYTKGTGAPQVIKTQGRKRGKKQAEVKPVRVDDTSGGGGGLFDIGHSEQSAVSQQRKTIAENELVKWTLGGNNEARTALLKKLLQEVDWSIKRWEVKNTDIIEVGLESVQFNRLKGSTSEKDLAEKLEADINKVLQLLESKNDGFFASVEGSDSYITKTNKRVLKNFTQDKFKSKNVRSNIKVEKIKVSSPSPVKKRIKPKAKVAKGGEHILNKGGTKNLKRTKRAGGRTESLFTLMALINKRLPEEVRRNMGTPRLENVSGRFASSVKLTSVTTTRRGFPSFGYTYQKNPYQVYEDGAMGLEPWANTERDPRQLIDASIREIASEMAIGRFYTRRE